MQFDDRLATVLRHRASDGRAARTQFRQLLDLLGARRGAYDRNLLSAADGSPVVSSLTRSTELSATAPRMPPIT